jgi:signal transduction histidine kinase
MERNHLLLRVRDAGNEVVLATRKTPVEGDPLRRPFAMVFGDWTLEIQSTGSASARLARDNFVLVLTLSVLLGSVLIGAIALALRAADRTLRLSDMKSEFVSNVSHELRTPVASIRVFGELLRLGRANSPEKSREYGAAIEAEARRLSDLIDNILDFSRIESGRKTYRLVRTDLASLVATTVETFRVRLIDSGVDLEYQAPREPLPEVEADPEAIGLALNNLLDNAVKYSGDSRRVFLRLFPEDGSVVLSVQDFGIGIPEAEQKKIFERFHRVGSGLVHDVKGSGLGLAIVHHIMKAHRGRVAVRSAPGEGSLFSLHLPPAPAVPEAGAIPEHPTARRAPVVEPDPRVGRG